MISYIELDKTREIIYSELGLTANTDHTQAVKKLSHWMIDNVSWSKSAAEQKDDFICNGPMIFGGDDAFTINQALIGRDADCVGQANALAYLGNGLGIDIKTAGCRTTDSGHRIAVWNDYVIDISLCQSYKHTVSSDIPDGIILMTMDEYVDRAPIDMARSVGDNMIEDNCFKTTPIDDDMIHMACDDLFAATMSDSLKMLNDMNDVIAR